MELELPEESALDDYTTVPAGTYVCRIAEVRTGTTRAGDARWGLRLVVDEGEYTGRLAAWDSLIFSTRGVTRVRRILSALQLPNRGKVNVKTEEIEGRRALVEIRPAEYEDKTGTVIRRNEVPYDGYRQLPEDDEDEASNDDPPMAGLPF